MEQVSNEIRAVSSDPQMDALLAGIGDAERPFSRHFTQGEDFFIKLDGEYTVPHIAIHHDVRQPVPSAAYRASLLDVTGQVARLAPQVLRGLSYFFDPAEILRPCFYHLSTYEGRAYLYLLRIDLMMRASEGAVIERGTNDTTPRYRSRKLFLETAVVPLAEAPAEGGGPRSFRVRQTISQTWIGEQGRGYFVQGIWMDADLTKFFSRLFLPQGKRTYPYYPFLCKYKTICHSVLSLAPEGRKATIPWLHRAIQFLQPAMERIQNVMRTATFSEEIGYFRELKTRVPEQWYEPWKSIRVEAYLNEQEMKEYRIDD